jgi:hypothetical protein
LHYHDAALCPPEQRQDGTAHGQHLSKVEEPGGNEGREQLLMRKAKIEYPTEPAQPAFHIPLSDEQLRTLGEVCAIQGQIEFLMRVTVMALRGVSMRTARKNVRSLANAGVWLETVEKHAVRQDIKELARAICDEIDALRRGRNDFVHAVFAYAEEREGNFSIERNINTIPRADKPAVAVHSFKTIPIARLKFQDDAGLPRASLKPG